VSTESGSDRVLALSLWERVGRGLSGENVAYQYFFKRGRSGHSKTENCLVPGRAGPLPSPLPQGEGERRLLYLEESQFPISIGHPVATPTRRGNDLSTQRLIISWHLARHSYLFSSQPDTDKKPDSGQRRRDKREACES